MKSRFQKKKLRKSSKRISRKIQKGGMSIDDATKMLTAYGCSFAETVGLVTSMTKKGKVNDSLFQVTVLLHQKYKKSWTDALSLALDYQQGNGDVDLDLLFSMI